MTCTAATFAGVTAYDRRPFALADHVRAMRRGVVIGLGTVTTAGAMVGAVTVTAAWVATVALGTAPHKAKAPLALEMSLFAKPPPGGFVHVANVTPVESSSAQAGDLALIPDPLAGEAGKGSRLDAEQIAMASTAEADDVSMPSAYRGDRLPIHRQRAVTPAKPASRQAAATTPSSRAFASLDLFDPEPTVVAALSDAPMSVSLFAPNRFVERGADALPPSPRRLDNARVAPPRIAEPRDIASAPAKPAKSALPQLASLTPSPPVSKSSSWFRRLFGRSPAHSEVSALDADGHTAVYDIEAHTVYMPNGTELEAHSGLGAHLDDPQSIRDKARGPTPPNVYDLALRSGLFHGVQAIRLNPVSDSKMFGRDGILAHPYMLGPSGQSFGCVSFKDYPEFLRAFERGDVDRIVVVPHLQSKPSDDQARNTDGGHYSIKDL
jgi:hypothetical protein